MAAVVGPGAVRPFRSLTLKEIRSPQPHRMAFDPKAFAAVKASVTTPTKSGSWLRLVDHAAAPRNAPSRQAMNSAIETTATMIVEIALIWGETPNLIEL